MFLTAYTQRGNWLGPAIMFFAALMTLLIAAIILIDQAVRGKNVPMMKKIEDSLLPGTMTDRIQLSVGLPHWTTRAIVGSVLVILH